MLVIKYKYFCQDIIKWLYSIYCKIMIIIFKYHSNNSHKWWELLMKQTFSWKHQCLNHERTCLYCSDIKLPQNNKITAASRDSWGKMALEETFVQSDYFFRSTVFCTSIDLNVELEPHHWHPLLEAFRSASYKHHTPSQAHRLSELHSKAYFKPELSFSLTINNIRQNM